MDIIAYLACIFIGITLGLIGGGGSTLTIPVLVYLFSIDAVLATGYSLFIVGATSLIGAYSYLKKQLVNLKAAIVFGIPSIIAVFFTRTTIIPAIPDLIFEFGSFTLSKSLLLMLIFSILMIFASVSMIKPKKLSDKEEIEQKLEFNYPLIVIEGLIVGVLTGLVGAGGGFLIIPALVLFSKLPMKEAIGTSLLIIAAKSLIGFIGESMEVVIDWKFLLIVTSFAIVGIIIGIALSKKIDGSKLKSAFGWFVLTMGVYIILAETVFR